MEQPETYEIGTAVVSRIVGDETVIVDLETETYFGLNQVGSVIWSEMEKRASVPAIVDVVVGRFDVSSERATEDVRTLLGDLQRAGLARPVE